MWKFILLIVFIIILLALGAAGISVAPVYFYEKILNKDHSSKWYKQPKDNKDYKVPVRLPFNNMESLSADNLWREFQLGDVQIPLPYKHPFYQIIPIINYKNDTLDLGLSFKDMASKELARVYFMRNELFNTKVDGGEVFNLPIMKEILSKINRQILWADLFSKEIGKLDVKYPEMLYNLFILQLRHKLFHPKTIHFGHIGQQDVGILILENPDKDFYTEYIMTLRNGMIYSYLLITRKNSPEAEELRQRFLNKVKFIRGDYNVSKITYDEFKILDFTKKVKQEGLVFLYSAWSNWEEEKRKQLLKEIIFYAEKGKLKDHLKVFYPFAMKKYGKSLSSLRSEEIEDPELRLARSIEEQEEIVAIEQEVKSKVEAIPEEILEQDLKSKIDRAKQSKNKKKKREIILD